MNKREILIIHGKDLAAMAYELAGEAELAALIGDRKKKIGLKPNLVTASHPDRGATTHPEILAGLIQYLRETGFANLLILEGAWAGARTGEAFRTAGYVKLSGDLGVPLIDTQQDSARAYDCGGMTIEICDSAMSLDFMINLPVMKGHCQTLMTCALKNNKGVIPNKEKRRFHAEGLHKPIAHLNTRVRNDFILVDGICGDPDFEEGGSPLYGGRLYAGLDPVLIDAFSAAQLGYLPSDIPYIGLAEKLGVGQADIGKALVRELNVPEKRVVSFKSRGRAREFEPLIDARNACSSCYASLVLALSLLDTHTRNKIKEPLAIGQGFAGKKGRTGIGRCTAAFDRTLPGCPPSHQAMLEFLKQIV